MTTYSKETALFKPDAIADDIGSVRTIATTTNQHFWFASSGADAGAHITETDQATFVSNPTGGNLLATSNGIAVREGLDELATMSQDGFMAKSYDSNNNEIEIAHLGYGNAVDNVGQIGLYPYYTIGRRKANTVVGGYSVALGDLVEASNFQSVAEGGSTKSSGVGSHAEGINTQATNQSAHSEGTACVASGLSSHAEGVGTVASGDDSHAQNEYTRAQYAGQTAIGKYNDNKSADAFEVGNGSSNNSRSNAFSVGWDGQLKVDGATVGSIMTLHGSTDVPLSTSYKTINLSSTPDVSSGNAFSGASNGIQCLYAGTVHLVASIRFFDGFTANDYCIGQIYNTTQSTPIQTGRMRTSFVVFNGDVVIDAYARVNANDVILVRAENGTGGRGTVNAANTTLTACYIAK